MKKLLLIAVVLFVGCKGDAIEQKQVGDFNLELLFEKDSCKVYRFLDGGRYIYWSDCRGQVNSAYTRRSGKSTTTHHQDTLNSGR